MEKTEKLSETKETWQPNKKVSSRKDAGIEKDIHGNTVVNPGKISKYLHIGNMGFDKCATVRWLHQGRMKLVRQTSEFLCYLCDFPVDLKLFQINKQKNPVK